MSTFVRRDKRVVSNSQSTDTNPTYNNSNINTTSSIPTDLATHSSRSIPGTRVWLNGLLLSSTGCNSIDTLIGGGVPLNTCILIQQDKYTNIHDILLKYYLSDGIAYKHNIINISSHTNEQFDSYLYTLPYNNTVNHSENDNIVQSINDLTTTDTADQSSTNTHPPQLNNASRYNPYLQANRAVDYTSNLISQRSVQQRNSTKSTTLCCSYDCNKYVDESSIKASHDRITHVSVDDYNQHTGQQMYDGIFNRVKQILIDQQSMNNQPNTNNTVTRVAIHSVGDIQWCYNDSNHIQQLLWFIYRIQSLMRQCRATCMLTLPTHLYTADIIKHIQYTCDIVYTINEFKQSYSLHTQQTHIFGDYDGVFTINKVSSLHTLLPTLPHETEYLYKMTRRKLQLDRVSLPPESSRTESDDTKKSIVKQRQTTQNTASKSGSAIEF